MIHHQPPVVASDHSIIVLNKPPGMSVHPPSPEAREGQVPRAHEETLVDWMTRLDPELVQRFPKSAGEIWRPGIVHRLDKDSSGLMVVARTPDALQNLQDQFRSRTVEKVYRALVAGMVDAAGELRGAIARSDEDPTRQAIRRLSFSWSKGNAREAETTYHRVSVSDPVPGSGFKGDPGVGSRVSLVELHPKTGRMHQLRVQLAGAGWPILGDDRYGTKLSRKLSEHLGISRQMLHAMRLEFNHPETGKRARFCLAYPPDFLKVLTALTLPTESCEDQS